jgi:hypothetical protein
MGGRSLPKGAWPRLHRGYTFTISLEGERRSREEVMTRNSKGRKTNFEEKSVRGEDVVGGGGG